MTNGSAAIKIYRSLVAEIVRSYVVKNHIDVDQIGRLISTLHRTLSDLGDRSLTPAAIALLPAVPIRRSVQPDYVICLECGFRARTLRRHLWITHGLEPAAYRARWQLAPHHPVTAPAYSASRSAMAKQIGLGRKPTVVEMTAAPR
jgi:predicted transcriptional regulator